MPVQLVQLKAGDGTVSGARSAQPPPEAELAARDISVCDPGGSEGRKPPPGHSWREVVEAADRVHALEDSYV